MAVKERVSQLESVSCTCGGDRTLRVGTVQHKILDRNIKIQDIPHYRCDHCGEIEYNIKQVNVTPLLRYALENDMNEVSYIDFNRE
ncbi:YgiT-type zinc finger protein [Rossellomorea marisflavi]|uniref:YgiT-type zinc finger protein n=1 Tax=Rossellomorea marisflavi TaxID=189381 RepID=UPI0025AFB54B|nr:YgiT-type zinc finger protein [Rossellomorea marisflavi]WJV20687.1 YgiT-type zinc finger protein [Rossellomorea marisflavi]